MTKKKRKCDGFGERFRESLDKWAGGRRGAKGEFAAQLGMTLRGIQHMYSGVMPQIDKVEDAARVLGVSPAWLAFGEGE